MGFARLSPILASSRRAASGAMLAVGLIALAAVAGSSTAQAQGAVKSVHGDWQIR